MTAWVCVPSCLNVNSEIQQQWRGRENRTAFLEKSLGKSAV
jgi:hypothetical protein